MEEETYNHADTYRPIRPILSRTGRRCWHDPCGHCPAVVEPTIEVRRVYPLLSRDRAEFSQCHRRPLRPEPGVSCSRYLERARPSTSCGFSGAGSLQNILALAEHLSDPSQSKVDQAVRNYAHLVVTAEWPMLAVRQNSPATADGLNALLVLLSSDEVASTLNTSVQSLMLQQAVQARSMRDLRIALSHTHVNPLKWLGMAFLGFLTMISIAWCMSTGRAPSSWRSCCSLPPRHRRRRSSWCMATRFRSRRR